MLPIFLFTMLLAFKHIHLSSFSEIIGENFFGCVFVVCSPLST